MQNLLQTFRGRERSKRGYAVYVLTVRFSGYSLSSQYQYSSSARQRLPQACTRVMTGSYSIPDASNLLPVAKMHRTLSAK